MLLNAEGGIKEVKNLEDWAAVQRVYKQTKSKRATARLLGISRNTVKKLLALSEPPVYQRTDYTSKIDNYKEVIIEWRCEPYLFNGTRIFRELKKRGYTGSISPIYRFLNKVDEDVGRNISKKATVRHESPPGDQAQFDWTEYDVVVGNRWRKVYCFSVILAASRKKAICFSLNITAESIYEAIQELFDDLGGVTLELLIDNPKALVIENNPKSEDEVKYNSHALMMAKHLGTELNACPCYWPRKKGKVERPFNYIEEQFIKGNTFATMEELNHRGKKFIDEWCDEKHSTTKRIPNQHYLLEEKSVLHPTPPVHYQMKTLGKRKISPDSYLSLDTNKYSVPVKYVGKTVLFRVIYGFRIEIYDVKKNFILSVEQSDKRFDTLTNKEHYEPIAKKVSTSIPQIRRDFTRRYSNGYRYLEAAGRKFDQPTHYARKIMELQELYDDETLDTFIGIAVDENKMDIKAFRSILREYNSGDRSLTKPQDVNEASQDYCDDHPSLTRDCSYYEFAAKEEPLCNP